MTRSHFYRLPPADPVPTKLQQSKLDANDTVDFRNIVKEKAGLTVDAVAKKTKKKTKKVFEQPKEQQ